ncbi:MAG TPA: MarR family winged helix-turn-helix transcriptional regulator [Gaiellales bacterium]
MTPSPQNQPGGGLGFALAHAAQVWRSELTDVLADLSVTAPQFFVLAALLHLHGREAPTQREIAERTGTDANTTSQIVRGLETRGLLGRQPHARDSRAFALTLTNDGLDLARECTRRARALNETFFAGADPMLYDELNALALRTKSRYQRPQP